MKNASGDSGDAGDISNFGMFFNIDRQGDTLVNSKVGHHECNQFGQMNPQPLEQLWRVVLEVAVDTGTCWGIGPKVPEWLTAVCWGNKIGRCVWGSPQRSNPAMFENFHC